MVRLMPRLRCSLLALVLCGLIPAFALAVDKMPATIKLIVPADAVVEVDGAKRKQTGIERTYLTPDLDAGKKYEYRFKITYMVDGKPVVVEKTVSVEAGKEAIIDLGKDVTAVVKEAPKNEEPKKEEPKKVEVKAEEPKKVEVKAEEPKKVEVKAEEPKKLEVKKEAPKAVSKFEFEEPKKEVRLDVPYVPTPTPVVEAMLKLANVTDKDVVYDLGCGDGRIVITAVKDFKAKSGLGIELFPERVKLSNKNAREAGVDKKVEIREGSVLDLKNVSEASVVTLYLLPDINLKLMPMLKKTLKPGSRIVSHDFDMGDWKAEKEISVKDETGREHTIYLWTIGEDKKETPKEELKVEPKVVTKEELKVEPKTVVKEEPKVVVKETPKVVVKEEPKVVVKETPKVVVKEEPKAEPKTIVVPYVPTPQKVVDAMLKLAEVKKTDTVYDLGCGDGRIVITAISKFGARNGWGLDLNPERIKDSNENAKKAGVDNRALFTQGDVLKLKDVSEAQVVTLYLLPEVNRRLAPVLQKTLKPGSRIVSHDFDMGDWKADKKIEITDDDGTDHVIYLWIIK